jgi:L-ascorbate metabolism protein UlaG (beta-lactamase superfamily)
MRPGSRLSLLFAAAITVALVALSAPVAAAPMGQAQPDAKPEANRTCAGLVAARPRPVPAAFELTALGADQVRITYVGHATFLIESPQLVRIATDYNDFVRPPLPPDIITMNHAHSTHYTNHPDPGIKYVLRGWRDDGGPAGHDLTLKDVHVRSVSTNIRDWAGGTERYGNSIFVFEIANLCIAHLGHLHHTLTPQQLDEIGRVDVVMAPVDGSFTLDLDGMVEVLQSLKPQIIIPMHFFSTYTLDRFLARMRQSYPIEHNEIPAIVVSRATLPASPTVVVLPGH